jgi:gamma-glutamylcyclotransferase (GGCT)/AIG2-like uncharacterized protein YtfP
MKLFVYGTLKKGQCRSGQLTGRLIAEQVSTQPDYRMYRLDGFPGLVEVQPGMGVSVTGELWEIDQECLQRIDRLEGVDEGYYERRPIRLVSAFEHVQIEAYFYLKSVADREDCGPNW